MKHILTSFLIIAMTVTSCDVLDQDPVSNITLDNAFENESDLRAGVIGVYNRLAFETTSQHHEMPLRYLFNGEYRADSYMSKNAPYKAQSQGNFDNTWPWANWQNYYSALRDVNNLIFYGAAIPDNKVSSVEEKNRLLGEGYFLRAFILWNLVRTWDNVVLRTEPLLSANGDFNGEQVPPSQVLTQVEADLLQAAQLLPTSYPQSDRGRVTRGAAHALLAKYYVYASSPYALDKLGMGTPQWDKAASFADSVIKNSNYNLVASNNYATIFTQNKSSEAIWEIVYDAMITGPNAVNDLTNQFLPRKFTAPSGGGYALQPSDKLIDAFKSVNDSIRFNAVMAEVRTQDGWDKSDVGKTVPGGQKHPNHYVKKYPGNVQGNIRYSDNDIIVLRLADVILLRAEALFEMGDVAGAQAELDKITQRAGIGSRAVSIDEIMLQRWLELCFEGDRWYDLKRRQWLEKETGAFAAYPKGYTFPIINGEVANNPNVQQNPGW